MVGLLDPGDGKSTGDEIRILTLPETKYKFLSYLASSLVTKLTELFRLSGIDGTIIMPIEDK
jgi:hypothetical protein